ncbi:histidinol-phosphate transaminase [Pasteurellaceae bacterium Macca]|nr:histidinol-phosphate transaminase [Pasteurellaceae bacterium Macca]
MAINTLTKRNVQQLTPYQSARRLGGNGDIWLNANEYAVSPDFNLSQTDFNRYPEPQPQGVIQRYAQYAGVMPENILVSRGGDESIELIIRTFCEADEKILYCPPTYGMYAVSAETCGIQTQTVPLLPDFQLDVAKIEEALNHDNKIKVLFLCNPNNPTGTLCKRSDLEHILHFTAGRAIVVVDEAYIDFCPEHSLVGALANYPHLAIIRTLSKAFALAGLRCGFTLANPELIAQLQKVIAPYPLPTVVADIAEQALQPQSIAQTQTRIAEILENRQWFAQALSQLPNVEHVFTSFGNYVLVKFTDGEKVFQALWNKGIILRNQHSALGLNHCIRITIGSRSELETVLNEIQFLTKE